MQIIRTGTRVVLTLIALASLMPDRVASAQSPERFEVGGQVSALRLQNLGPTPAGFGGRFSYELLDWLSVESEFNLFPRETFSVPLLPQLGGGDLRMVHRRQRSEALFGVKLGMRTGRFGLFGKVRPGFARLSDQSVECLDATGFACAAVSYLQPPDHRTDFALDLGGVFEFYPSTRTVARVDVGDTIIRYGGFTTSCPTCTSHNVSSRVGIGLRF
jgi:hypothetical protein